MTLDRIADLAAEHVSSPAALVQVTPMPELPELVTHEGFRAAFAMAQDLGVVLPVHLCASPSSRAACGPEEPDRLGVLGPGLLGHCIAIDDHDVHALAGARVGIAHCPSANQVFPGGTTPVVALRTVGASVGVGLDNASLQPRVDLLGEARGCGPRGPFVRR